MVPLLPVREAQISAIRVHPHTLLEFPGTLPETIP